MGGNEDADGDNGIVGLAAPVAVLGYILSYIARAPEFSAGVTGRGNGLKSILCSLLRAEESMPMGAFRCLGLRVDLGFAAGFDFCALGAATMGAATMGAVCCCWFIPRILARCSLYSIGVILSER